MSPSPLRPATSGLLAARPDGPDRGRHLLRVAGPRRRRRRRHRHHASTAAPCPPGDLYAALPGFNVHGADFAADARRRRRGGGPHRRGGPRARCDAAAVPVARRGPRPREVLGAVAATVYGDPAAALHVIGVTGTNGKTTTAYLVESALRAHGQRTGLIGTVETRIGDERLESVRTTPEATDLHALLARHARAGRRRLRHGGLQPRPRAAAGSTASSSTWRSSPTSRRTTSTSTPMDGLLRRQGLPLHPRALPCGGRLRRRRLGARAWRRRPTVPTTTLATTAEVGRDADWLAAERPADVGAFALRDGPRAGSCASCRPARTLQRRQHRAGGPGPAAARCWTPTEVEPALAVAPDVPGRMEVVVARWPRAARGASSTTPTRPTRSTPPSRRCGPRPPAG